MDAFVPLIQEALDAGDGRRVAEVAWRAYRARVAAFLYTMGARDEDRTEVLQIVFMKCQEQASKLRAETLCGWLVTVARYELCNVNNRNFRRSEGNARMATKTAPDGETLPDDPVTLGEMRGIIAAYRGELNAKDTIIFDHAGGELSDCEVAKMVEEATGVRPSESAIKNRRMRVRREIAVLLRRGGFSCP